MGTLRLKRGTKTALTTNPGFTPAEGELVYTTDSKEVFVGDGATQGGVPVSVSTQNLEDLGNVQALAAQKDQILVYNGSNWAASANPALDVRGNIYGDDSTLLVDAINGKIVGPVDTTSVTATALFGNLTGDTQGSHTGGVVGNVVGNTTGSHTGPMIGDTTGSVFADDSTILVDAVGSLVVGNVKTSVVEAFTNDANIKPQLNVTGEGTYGELNFARGDGTGDLRSGASNAYGQLKFFANDSNGYAYNVYVQGGNKGLKLFLLEDFATFDSEKSFIFENTGRFGIGTQTPAAKVDISGEVLLGRLDQTAINALTAVNGMIVYNTTTNKFQGYENGAWANLI